MRRLLIVFLVSSARMAVAQAKAAGQHDPTARIEIFGEYSRISDSFIEHDSFNQSAQGVNGWEAGAALRLWHGLAAKGVAVGYSGNYYFYDRTGLTPPIGFPQSSLFVLGGLQYSVQFWP